MDFSHTDWDELRWKKMTQYRMQCCWTFEFRCHNVTSC